MHKSIALFFILVFVSLPAMAIDTRDVENAGFQNLTTEQQAEVLKNIAQLKEQNKATNTLPSVEEVPAAEKVDKWVDISTKVGAAIAATAKEIGVAANEFVKTPVGKITVALIVYKVMGPDLIDILEGLIWLVFGSAVWLFIALRARPMTVTYDKTKTNIFGNHPVTSKERGHYSEEDLVFLGVTAGIVLCMTVILI